MRYTVLHSSETIKAAGLPFSAALISPRKVLAAFADEEACSAYVQQLNGPVQKLSLSEQIALAQNH